MTHLVVSRRGIVHAVESLDDNAATACGKGSRDLMDEYAEASSK